MLLFLALELGLTWVLLYFKLRALVGDTSVWTTAYRFWVRVFALAFVLSFAASFPVLIQFGSLWPGLMRKIGDIAGPLLAAAMLTAFVFKSCFLGAMLFGQRRFTPAVHTLMVTMVALGVALSCFFLLVLLSWMHTPTGASLVNGQYSIHAIWQVIFNPALPWYVALFVLASFLATGFLMMGVIAVQAMRHPIDYSDKMVAKTGVHLMLISMVLLVAAAVGTGYMNARHLPAKAAATAAYWDSGSQPQLLLFALPDTETAANNHVWPWPDAGTSWLGQAPDGKLQGLDQFSGMQPPVFLTFWTFRLAVLIGFFMVLTAAISYWQLRRADYDPAGIRPIYQRLLRMMMFSGWPLLLAGLAWLMFGSLPYAVTGTITLSEIAGTVSFDTLLGGYLAYLVLYAVLLLGFFHLLGHIVRYGVVPIARRRGRA